MSYLDKICAGVLLSNNQTGNNPAIKFETYTTMMPPMTEMNVTLNKLNSPKKLSESNEKP